MMNKAALKNARGSKLHNDWSLIAWTVAVTTQSKVRFQGKVTWQTLKGSQK